MKRRVVWSRAAQEDYHRQLAYIAKQSAANAELVDERLMAAIDQLADMPLGHAGRVSGTYEKLVRKTSLVIAYALGGGGRVEILRIIHGARNWPEGEWPDD